MARAWLISAQLAIVLGLPGLANAQAARALASPIASRSIVSLASRLDSPSAAPDRTEPTAIPSLMPEGWTLDVSVLTSLPLSVGLDAQIQSPLGIFGNVSVGHTPGAYLDMVSTLVRDTGAYGDDIQPLISDSIRSGGWNLRLGIGFNPIEGLEISVGYTLIAAASGLSVEAIQGATGQRLPSPSMTEVPLSIEMHALHGRVAYRFILEEHFVIRAAIGWTHAFAANVRVDVPDEVRRLPNDPATEIETAVSNGFGEYGFTPEVQISAGYRF